MLATTTSRPSLPSINFSIPTTQVEIFDLTDHRRPGQHYRTSPRELKAPAPEVRLPQEETLSAVDLLTGRWTLQVLWVLRCGPVRLGQLHRLFPASSKKVLTETLRKLERCQVLYRRDLSGRIRHVEYHLSPDMRPEVCSLLDQLERWGEAYRRHTAETSL